MSVYLPHYKQVTCDCLIQVHGFVHARDKLPNAKDRLIYKKR